MQIENALEATAIEKFFGLHIIPLYVPMNDVLVLPLPRTKQVINETKKTVNF
jgi:hypothetical protein